jgi:uncharacterized protein
MKTTQNFLILIALLVVSPIISGADIPYLTGRVNDNAGILSKETAQILTDSLKAHEDRTGNQVVVLTIPSLDGDNIEDYANKVFNEWKLGQKGKDNGILIVVVPDDRRMRIEVGYGLEGTMPDLLASRIIQEIATPRFREGDYNGGITDCVNSVIKVLDGESIPETVTTEETASESTSFMDMEKPSMPLTERILIGAFIFGIIGLFTIIGIFTPGVGWFLYIFLIPFWAMFPIVIVGSHGALICLITYLIVFPVAKIFLKKTKWYKKANKDLRTKGKASVGGFVFSSGGSGSSWSSGGGSSFSGGGGSSGGGGASGSW